MISGKGVCDGISKTASTLFRIMNMESKVISGQADGGINHKGPHEWNIVKVNGKRQNLDITFNNTTSLFIPNHRYFNISTKDFLKDHSLNEKSIRILNEKGMY